MIERVGRYETVMDARVPLNDVNELLDTNWKPRFPIR